jgi:sentrin-specific protease 1
MEIQVLDSLGTSQDRKDLTNFVSMHKLITNSLLTYPIFDFVLQYIKIKGLQRQIGMISQCKELKDHRWPDLQVASWPLREIEIAYAKQTDRYALKSSLPIYSIILILMFLLIYIVALYVASFF